MVLMTKVVHLLGKQDAVYLALADRLERAGATFSQRGQDADLRIAVTANTEESDLWWQSEVDIAVSAAKKLAEKGQFDAIIALGAVIRGGTPHFDFVAGECNKGLAQVSLEYGLPVSFGVITTDSIEQAIERSGTKAGNKGSEAALGALEMVNVMSNLDDLA